MNKCIYTYIYIYIHVYVYIYIFTYIHIRIHAYDCELMNHWIYDQRSPIIMCECQAPAAEEAREALVGSGCSPSRVMVYILRYNQTWRAGKWTIKISDVPFFKPPFSDRRFSSQPWP